MKFGVVNWNYLETFVILSETLSFSATAKALKTAQPVVSRQIKILEANLGYPLFLRTRKKVLLSEEGRELKLRLAPLVENIKNILFEKEQPQSILAGTIRLGSIQEAGEILLNPKLSEFRQKNPEMRFHLSFGSSSEVIERIVNGQIDFGLVHRTFDRKSLNSFLVAQDRSVLIASRKNAKNWRSQPSYSFVGYREQDAYLREFVARNLTKAEGKKVKLISSLGSHRLMIQWVHQQEALAVLPRSSAMQYLDGSSVEIVLEDKKTQPLYLICLEQILVDKRKKVFLEDLLKKFRSHSS